jgi:hypothetical protein
VSGKYRPRHSSRAKSGKVPPSSEVAAYAVEQITCRNCGAKPGSACVEQAESWRSCCSERFADGAAAYVPIWKAARREEDSTSAD